MDTAKKKMSDAVGAAKALAEAYRISGDDVKGAAAEADAVDSWQGFGFALRQVMSDHLFGGNRGEFATVSFGLQHNADRYLGVFLRRIANE